MIPRRAKFRGSVAQRLEQGTHNPLVLGSNPSAPILKLVARLHRRRMRNGGQFHFGKVPVRLFEFGAG